MRPRSETDKDWPGLVWPNLFMLVESCECYNTSKHPQKRSFGFIGRLGQDVPGTQSKAIFPVLVCVLERCFGKNEWALCWKIHGSSCESDVNVNPIFSLTVPPTQRRTWAWCSVFIVHAAHLFHPQIILCPTRVRSWKLDLQVRVFHLLLLQSDITYLLLL